MTSSIVQAVANIKRNVAEYLTANAIKQACRDVGHTWRERKLGPVQTVWTFLLQILHGNTSCSHAVRLGQLACSAEAYCEARARLPLKLLQLLVQRTLQAARRGCATALWYGHRTFLVDGSGVSMPDTPELQQHFGQSGQQLPGCGFPQAHLLAMFDAATGLLIRLLVAPLRTHDQSQVAHLHPELKPGDVLVGDRGFASFVHLSLLCGQKLHGVFRAHQRQLVSFRQDRRLVGKQAHGTKTIFCPARLIQKLGRFDQIVEYLKPKIRPQWLDATTFAALPATLHVRELRYRTCVRGFRVQEIALVTTLLDAQRYSAEALAELYRSRWEVETNFGYLKTTMKMDVLRCESVAGVLRELTMFALVYNLVRLVMLHAAREQRTRPTRVSFVDALRWLMIACQSPGPLEIRVNTLRPNRFEPRVKKRRPKEYDLMNKPRCQLRQELATQRVTP